MELFADRLAAAIVDDELYFIGGNYSDGQQWTEGIAIFRAVSDSKFLC